MDQLSMQLCGSNGIELQDDEGAGESDNPNDRDEEFILVDLHRVSRDITSLIFVVCRASAFVILDPNVDRRH
jgi:stress response protein SCP2